VSLPPRCGLARAAALLPAHAPSRPRAALTGSASCTAVPPGEGLATGSTAPGCGAPAPLFKSSYRAAEVKQLWPGINTLPLSPFLVPGHLKHSITLGTSRRLQGPRHWASHSHDDRPGSAGQGQRPGPILARATLEPDRPRRGPLHGMGGEGKAITWRGESWHDLTDTGGPARARCQVQG
jgi:hypothetical protein